VKTDQSKADRFLEAYREAPEDAFQQLMNEFKERVYLFCHRACYSPEDAQDLAQEVFIRAWKGLPRFRGHSSISTWLYRIAWNVCAGYLERKKRSVELVPIKEDCDEPAAGDGISLTFKDPQAERLENAEFVRGVLRSLPAAQQLVLTLYYVEEQSYEEMASVTGWPMGTVKATLHRGRNSLRALALKVAQRPKRGSHE